MLGLIDELDGPPPGAALARRRVDRRARRDARPSSAARSGPRSCTASTAARRRVADLDAAARLHGLVAELVREREVDGVHDVSDGGLAVALCEMAFGGDTGFRVDLRPLPARVVHGGRGRVRRVDVAGRASRSAAEQVAAVLGRGRRPRACPPR